MLRNISLLQHGASDLSMPLVLDEHDGASNSSTPIANLENSNAAAAINLENSKKKNDTKNLVRAWSWNERAIIARVIARSRTFRRTTPDHTSGTPSQISGTPDQQLNCRCGRDLTKADRSISCGSCNVFCAC